jgi:hypothetical protein
MAVPARLANPDPWAPSTPATSCCIQAAQSKIAVATDTMIQYSSISCGAWLVSTCDASSSRTVVCFLDARSWRKPAAHPPVPLLGLLDASVCWHTLSRRYAARDVRDARHTSLVHSSVITGLLLLVAAYIEWREKAETSSAVRSHAGTNIRQQAATQLTQALPHQQRYPERHSMS